MKVLPAQTTTVVYAENFDIGNGGWTIGGYNASWSYGIPSLPHISSANNCFSTGDAGAASSEPFAGCPMVSGPTTIGNFYNCCERSFVESPSINLSGVNSPQLSLEINLYCEQTYDGAKVQLSIDGGLTWMDIGQYTGSGYGTFPSQINCREQNWYNKNVINYLDGTGGGCSGVTTFFGGSSTGWSGGCSQAGSGACTGSDNHGSNGWVTASHCIPAAANSPDVKIRIVFGGGSQVYADGLAFDNVTITDSYPVVAFSYSPSAGCNAGILFNNTTDCGASWMWDFGHPGSPGNTSVVMDPDHIFPASGNYNVTLTATDFCGGISSSIQSVIVNVPTPPQINNITYTDPLICDSVSGTISLQLGATGIAPYEISYLFNNEPILFSGLTGNPIIITGLSPGNYGVFTIVDANGCMNDNDTSFILPYTADSLFITAYPDTVVLPGNPVTLHALTNIPSIFNWSPPDGLDDPASPDPVAMPEATTTYIVTAIDSDGCSVTTEVTVTIDNSQPCRQYYIPNAFTPNNDHKNDSFGVIVNPVLDLSKFELRIYDRWGRTVFFSSDPASGWDGSDMPPGLYIVMADFVCVNKKSSAYTGILNLVR